MPETNLTYELIQLLGATDSNYQKLTYQTYIQTKVC